MSINTAAAIVLRPAIDGSTDTSSSDGSQDNQQGTPQIGQDFYINKGLNDECTSSLSGNSGVLPNINNVGFGIMEYDVEKTTEDYAVYDNTANQSACMQLTAVNEDRSSMSSLTNDFSRQGRFFGFGGLRKVEIQQVGLSDSYHYDCNGASLTMDKDIMANNGSPWYSIDSNRIPVQNDNLSSSQNPTIELSLPAPEKELISSKKHLDELVQLPPLSSAASLRRSSRRVSDLDNSGRFCESDVTSAVSGRTGFATYVHGRLRETYDGASCRKKLAALFAAILFIVCLIVILAAALGSNQSIEPNGQGSYRIEEPRENDQIIATGDQDGSNELTGDALILISTESPPQPRPSFDAESQPLHVASTQTTPTLLSSQTSGKPAQVPTSTGSSLTAHMSPFVHDGTQYPTSPEASSTTSLVPADDEATKVPIPSETSSIVPSTALSAQTQTGGDIVQASEAPQISMKATTAASSTQAQTSSAPTTIQMAPETFSTTKTSTTSSTASISIVTLTTTHSTTTHSTTTHSTTTHSTKDPTIEPTAAPTTKSTPAPSDSPSTKDPTIEPTVGPTVKPTTGPTVLPSSSSPSADASTLYLKPASDTSIFRNRPINNYDDGPYLTVKGSNKASAFLRFDVSGIAGKSVARATLRLHSIWHDEDEKDIEDDDSSVGLSSVSVDALPFAGEWDASSVTWDNPVQSDGSFNLGRFTVDDYPYQIISLLMGGLQQVFTVDVTRAFRRPASLEGISSISLKLYSEDNSAGRIDFSSSEWKEGFLEPELVISLSDTQYPTISPTTTPPYSLPNECLDDCDADSIITFENEIGFDSIEDWIDDCIQTRTSEDGEDCKKERECKKLCEKDAKKAEKDALKKVEKDTKKCREKCDTSLSIDRQRSKDISGRSKDIIGP